jgi:hypothetical protein
VIIKKKSRLKTPCLGDKNASDFIPKKEYWKKVQNR